MAVDVRSERLRRNVSLYPWYVALFNAFFWMPVFFLFFNEHVRLEQVLQLEAIYYASVVLLEVPSGYFSDKVGRRPTLIISSAALTAAYVMFFLGSSFAMFAAAQVLLAMGIAFNSGTDASFHYDSLAALGRESEYGAREARAAHVGFLAMAAASLAGGAIALVELRFAYALSACAAIGMLGCSVLFREPTLRDEAPIGRGGFGRQLRACAGYLRQRTLLWLFGFTVLMIVLNHVPYEFYQPYTRLLESKTRMLSDRTPLVTGLHAAAAMLAGAMAAARSIRLRDRIGLGPTLLGAGVLQVIIIAVMGLVLHPVVLVLVLLRSVPRALMAAPINAAIAPRVQRDHRATYLSLQSLAGRLAFAATLAGLSLLGRSESPDDWSQLSNMLLVAAGIGVAGLLPLAVMVQWCAARGGATTPDPDQ